jgi:tRNA uridine 5-carboxymethylaminomethyl modification enzyme
LYKKYLLPIIQSYPNLTILEGRAESLVIKDGVVVGVTTDQHGDITSDTVVITTGTFLRGEIHIGLESRPAGRVGEQPARGLAECLERFGFRMGRMRTGTPPRLLASSIDYSGLMEQLSDNPATPFSFLHDRVRLDHPDMIKCFQTRTNTETHRLIRDNLHKTIHIKEEVKGPRYCPSIEAKVIRFADKPDHPVWLEPEGLDSDLVYPNGLSMSIPAEEQLQVLRSISGLERVEMVRPGYGVEYDYVDPTELDHRLHCKRLPNLFLAGQINRVRRGGCPRPHCRRQCRPPRPPPPALLAAPTRRVRRCTCGRSDHEGH